MGAPTIYRWDDTDAPVLNGTAGTAWNLLKSCLVTGYGTKAAAGWAMLFENVAQDTGVLRNNAVTGTGAIFQIIDDAVATYTYGGKSFMVTGYESMVDELTGTGPWGAPTSQGFYKSSWTTNVNTIPWVIIADDRAFYIFIAYGKTDNLILAADKSIHAYFVGDGVPFAAADPYFSLIISGGYSGDGSLGSIADCRAISASNHYAWRDAAGGNLGGGCCLMSFGPAYTNMGTISSAMPYPYRGNLVSYRPVINDGAGFTVRGTLPGFMGLAHYLQFYNFDILPIGTVDHIVMTMESYSNLYGQCAIDITAGFRP